MPLSDLAIRKAKAAGKPQKMTDGGGLYLLISPSGGKLWRYDYRFDGKRKTLALGSYPEIPLVEARIRHADARSQIAHGTDPGEVRKAEKQKVEAETVNTFGAIADEYLARRAAMGAAERTMEKNRWLLTDLAEPIRETPITKVTPHDVLKLLQKVENSGRRETAHRLRSMISVVFRHAIATLRAENDPTYALRGALLPVQKSNRAAITDPKQLGVLLRALDDSHGWATLSAALHFALLTAARPGEVRGAVWSEIDFEDAVWHIPAERMKMSRPHDVPLSFAAVRVLFDIKPVSGGDPDRLVFPSVRSLLRPLSENALNSRLRGLGFGKDEVTSHGFRATFSTLANQSGLWNPDAIERQLAHVEGNAVRRAYNRAAHWDERVKMMDWWADELARYKRLK